jgi:hypothetical protein
MRKTAMQWLGVVAGVVVFALLATQVEQARAAAASDSANKVTICHMSGHVGDHVVNPIKNKCAAIGGVVIEIAKQACSNGHGINAKLCAGVKPPPDEEKKEDADPGIGE